MTYTVKQQDGEYIVTNREGIIIAYCDTKAQAEDVKQAQAMDDERHAIESAYNDQQEARALRAEFLAEVEAAHQYLITVTI